MSAQAPGSTTTAATAGPPDVNDEINPFDQVVDRLERVAYGQFQAVPSAESAGTFLPATPEDYFGINGGYGIGFKADVHPFDSMVATLDRGIGLELDQRCGQRCGVLTGRWLFAPPEVEWSPGGEPTPTLWDPWRSHSLALLDTGLDFGGGHGLRGYGIGRALPITFRGEPRVLAGGVVDVREGTGGLAGLEGTIVFNGELRKLGFAGHLSVRLIDPEGRMRCGRELRPTPRVARPEPEVAYLVMRGEKRDPSIRTEYGPPAGSNVRLVTPAQMRSAEFRFDPSAFGGPKTMRIDRQVIGTLHATVTLDILAPPGTPEQPNTFTTVNVYSFTDAEGHEVGTITAEVEMGRSFGLSFPSLTDQPAMRYGGYGRLVAGSGLFTGVEGGLSVNSAIGIRPHALSMLNVLRILDPDHRFQGFSG